MYWIITKYLITAAVVVAVSEVAKRSDRLGALLASLPLVTLLALTWLYIEKQPTEKIANHAWYTFWYVVPTLPMFLAFPALLDEALRSHNGGEESRNAGGNGFANLGPDSSSQPDPSAQAYDDLRDDPIDMGNNDSSWDDSSSGGGGDDDNQW
jgi:hypothetical protein